MLSEYEVRAMCRVATILSNRDISLEDAEYTYLSASNAGLFAASDLRRAAQNLVDLGLAVQFGNHIQIASDMLSLLGGTIEDAHVALLVRKLPAALEHDVKDFPEGLTPEQRQLLLVALSRRFDDALRHEVGRAAERIVEAAARTELEDLGEFELSQQVKRVSLLSDQLGYDIVAPTISGRSRRFEVKGTTLPIADAFHFFLSRNEAEYGKTDSLWFMVACHISDLEVERGEILGWCSMDGIIPYLPRDVPNGTWAIAEITLPRAALQAWIPPPYLI